MRTFPAAVLGCAALLTACFLSTNAHGEFPVKGDIKFVFNVSSGPGAGRNSSISGYGNGKLPWYVYFPVDPTTMGMGPGPGQALTPSRFPLWPGCFPPPDAAMCGPGQYGPGQHGPGMPGHGVEQPPELGPMPARVPPTSRRFPDWPQNFNPAGQPSQFAYQGWQNSAAPPGQVVETGYRGYGPAWPTTSAYPVSWQQPCYYWR